MELIINRQKLIIRITAAALKQKHLIEADLPILRYMVTNDEA